MKVLWTHNFDPAHRNSGVFMWTLADALIAAGVDLELLYLGNLRSLGGIRNAPTTVSRHSHAVDLVHAQYGSACALVTGAWQGGPRVLTLRGSDWERPSSVRWGAHGWAASGMSRVALRQYDSVVCASQRMADAVARLTPPHRVEVMPSPVDTTLFQPRSRSEARELLGLDPDLTYVLFTAVDPKSPNKRLALAEQAVEHARDTVAGLSLMVGTDVDHTRMPWLVAAADVALLTSEHEGWPNCIKEALATNIPFVATDVSDLAAIAAGSGSCVVTDPTPRALGDALVQVVTAPEPSDLPRYVADMTLDVSVDRLISLYGRLLSDASTP